MSQVPRKRVPEASFAPMVIKGSKRRIPPEQMAALRESGRKYGGRSSGNTKTGASKVRSPEALAAAVAARIAANKARKHAVDVELPALHKRVAELEALVADLKARLKEET